MRRGWGALGLLLCGCWRVNPAFLVGFEEQSSGEVGGDTSGEPGMSSGSDTTSAADTTQGGGSSDAGSTAVEPGTTTGPATATATSTGDATTDGSTTGDPGTSGGSTTGGGAECQDAVLKPKLYPLLYSLAETPCDAMWEGGNFGNQMDVVPASCPVPAPAGFAQPNPNGLIVAPNVQFDVSLMTGTRSLVSKAGTIEGSFFGLDLAGTTKPCLVARVGCPMGGPSPCGVNLQVTVRVAGNDWGDPQIPAPMEPPLFVGEGGPVDIALSLAEFAGQKIDILLVTINDGGGLMQEVVAWENPRVVDVALP